ncbi:hypothetical protein [uncultured Microbulbifer sp.]|uniref:hypothetical protein n=1 Tax=uncultured Microbulbifer sp. TaxID=348147 RepID=UPI00261C2AA7|nr:hypothetical protein [uncultured Microbulbifer sp.]
MTAQSTVWIFDGYFWAFSSLPPVLSAIAFFGFQTRIPAAPIVDGIVGYIQATDIIDLVTYLAITDITDDLFFSITFFHIEILMKDRFKI